MCRWNEVSVTFISAVLIDICSVYINVCINYIFFIIILVNQVQIRYIIEDSTQFFCDLSSHWIICMRFASQML